MKSVLHITSGDCAGESLKKSAMPGELLVWHDILYDGPRNPGWPNEETLDARAHFLERVTGGGMTRQHVREVLVEQYQRLAAAASFQRIVLWFDACLFDQAMLAHLLVLLRDLAMRQVELLCIDFFPGIKPFDGLGQLQPSQLASLYDRRRAVTDAQFQFAEVVDRAFACQDMSQLAELARNKAAPLPWVPAAAARWLQEQPDPATGLGRLEQLVLDTISDGYRIPEDILVNVAAKDIHPQYWGDISLWGKINGLADRNPPLVLIEGSAERLPQWKTSLDLRRFTVRLVSPADAGS